MIRLRRTLERGRKHPVLGPILLIVLVLLLAMVFLHAAQEGHEAATEIGAFYLAILTILGPILLERMRRTPPAAVVQVRGDRSPPRHHLPCQLTRPAPPGTLVAPLRR